jgi:putative tryptophan/tyrosine transport system substrate-binding protein
MRRREFITVAENRDGAQPEAGGSSMIMKRAAFAAVLTFGVLAAALVTQAQQKERVARIGVIGNAYLRIYDTFPQALHDLGWIEGQNITIEYLWAEGRLDRLPDLAAEMVRRRPDLIVAITHRVALATKNATSTIPVVFASVNDPVGVGLVPSLARTGGNVTGLSVQGLDLIGKRLEILKEAAPQIATLAYLGNPDEPYWPAYLREVRRAGQVLGLRHILSAEVRDLGDFETAFASILRQSSDAIVVEPNAVNSRSRLKIAQFAAAHRLPTMYAVRYYVDDGGFMAYGPRLSVHYQRLAVYVDKILKGAKPADLPVEQPTKFELVINMRTARALGLDVPATLLARANEVIE